MVKTSVIITTYNRLEYLKEAFESVINQTGSEIEIIIVDDGSDDGTIEYLDQLKDRYNVKVLLQKHRGPGINRRLGFDYVTGRQLVFMDDDDFYTSDTVFRDANELMTTGVGSVFFNVYELDQVTGIVSNTHAFDISGRFSSVKLLNEFMISMPKPLSTFPAVFCVENLRKSGVESMDTLNDTQIYLRSFISGDAIYRTNFVGNYRVHGGSIGNSLTPTFIRENLQEKFKIAEELPVDFDKKHWFVSQAWVTLQYYIRLNPHLAVLSLLLKINEVPWSLRMRLEARLLKEFVKIQLGK